jgi:thymidylate synthase (FAD)
MNDEINPKYVEILDHGHVYLVDYMGDDAAIVQAARVSYGAGTKTINEDRGLIRYLLRHAHSSPIEMVEFKFGIKIPIFVMRQLVRHRCASTNEISARYSIMSDEFYIPALDQIRSQSETNKQGRDAEIDSLSQHGVQWIMQTAYENAYSAYKVLLGQRDGAEDHYDPYSEESPLLSNEFPGLARELARSVLPVANYTSCFWKIDLSNLFKFLKLRRDVHAQFEIRVLAHAMYKLIQPIVPLACEAAEDYLFHAHSLSRMETVLLKDALANGAGYRGLLESYNGDESALRKHYDLTKRELNEFKSNFIASQGG